MIIFYIWFAVQGYKYLNIKQKYKNSMFIENIIL